MDDRTEQNLISGANTVSGNARRDSQVQSELIRQGDLIMNLGEALTELEDRLSVVLISREVDLSSGGTEDQQMLVGLADNLNKHNEIINASYRQVRSILDRIEL